MNILFAINQGKGDNQFIKIHIGILQDLGHTVTASVEEFWQPSKIYDFVVINWPDSFFGWRVDISDEQVLQLNTALGRWKESQCKVLTFLHDEYSHFGRQANLNLLFELCYRKSDFLIHLGEYSKKKYLPLYPEAVHHVIRHPLYTDFQTDMERDSARKQIGVSEKEYLVLVPGAIRKTEEMDYCLGIYRKLPAKNKRLVFQKTNFLAKPPRVKSFTDLKGWVYYLFHTYTFKFLENIVFLQGFMENRKLSAYFAASDLVIIPRTDILNSGNILLAAQFGIPTVGTGAGNMKEILTTLEQLVIPQVIAEQEISIPPKNSLKITAAVERYAHTDVIRKQWQQILKP